MRNLTIALAILLDAFRPSGISHRLGHFDRIYRSGGIRCLDGKDVGQNLSGTGHPSQMMAPNKDLFVNGGMP